MKTENQNNSVNQTNTMNAHIKTNELENGWIKTGNETRCSSGINYMSCRGKHNERHTKIAYLIFRLTQRKPIRCS